MQYIDLNHRHKQSVSKKDITKTIYLLKINCGNLQEGSALETPLIIASYWGSIPVVEAMLKTGMDPDYITTDGYTPLIAASYSGHVEIVKLLVKATKDVDLSTIDGRTALMAACHNGHKKVVELLINENADFEATSAYGETPYFLAYSKNHSEIMKVLDKVGAKAYRRGIAHHIRTH